MAFGEEPGVESILCVQAKVHQKSTLKVHLMRSGKRSGGGPNLVSWNPVQSEEGGSDYEDPSEMERADSLRSISSMGVERADLGIGIQPLSSLVLRRVLNPV